MRNLITESITNPPTGVAVGVGVSASNLISSLPVIINIATLTYLVLLIAHKGYQMYKEWKGKDASSK